MSYNLWIREKGVVILALFDVVCRRTYWLDVQEHFRLNPMLRPRPRAKTVRVRIPERQIVSRRAVRLIRARHLGVETSRTWRVIS